MKIEKAIIVFYTLYFAWLWMVTFLMQDFNLLNYYAGFVVFFYFIFLKKEGDLFYFASGFILSLLFSVTSFSALQIAFDLNSVQYIPPWLPLIWGTTFVALRRLYLLFAG